jgi:hypothetical protein
MWAVKYGIRYVLSPFALEVSNTINRRNMDSANEANTERLKS